jgi:hypothetical protein
MKKIKWKALMPHVIAVVIFAIVAIIYCKPAFEGKVLQQDDTTQWKAMAQSSFEFKEKHGHFPLWTNSMFCGMPAYQIALTAENPFTIYPLSNILSLWLPNPAHFFFIACICFYFLALILRCNPYVAISTALAYAYCTYNPIIIAAGHETKMLALGYLPALIGSLFLIFNKKYIWGTALTAFFTATLIGANHLQITYYALIIIVFISISFLIDCIRTKNFKHLIVAAALSIFAAFVGVGVNAVTLRTTSEYGKYSIRGGSVLADEKGKGNATKTGLNKEYAFSYSLYKTEPLVMLIPHAYGGSSGLEVDEEKSKAIEKLRELPPQIGQELQNYLGAYWGGIGGTSGPPYIGAIIGFLALIGFVIVDKKYKWWILSACVFAIMLSWGKYFDGFNTWMLNNLPMYNKFRAPSMILVVPTFLLSMMAALSLQKIISTENKIELFEQYKKGLYVITGLLVVAVLVYLNADFMNEADKGLLKQVADIPDAQQKATITESVKSFLNALKEDRKTLFMDDLLRTIGFMFVAAVAIWAFIKNKISSLVTVVIIGAFAFIDVINVDLKYFNADKFEDKAEYADANFKATPIDLTIQQDTTHYRVFNLLKGVQGAFNADAKSAYYHNSIGGYHAAKLSIYQDLIENQLYNFPNCLPVMNMLNAKYIVQPDPQNGQPSLYPNPTALGNCWFVKGVIFKKGPRAVMNTLTTLNTKDSAVVDQEQKTLVKYDNINDSTASIQLVKNENDFIEYKSTSSKNEFAVFSEIYYPAGWKAYIDGKESEIVQTNYVLRGLSVPAGEHKITFEFKPSSYYSSLTIGTACSAIVWLLLLGAAFLTYRETNKKKV